MKTYLSLFKLRFMNNIQYRTAAIAGVCAQIFFGLVFIMVYYAFYNSNDISSAPMKWKELVNYLWLNQGFFTLTYIWSKDTNLLSMIKDGNVAYELCRPINFYKKWFASMYGSRIASVLLKAPLLFIFALLIPEPFRLGAPISLEAFILFLVSLIISSFLVVSIAMIYHLITFFTLDEKGILIFLMVFGDIFSGGTIPLPFFPQFLKNIAYLLPFRYIIDLPFRIYTGNISINNSIPDVIGGLIWLIVMLFLGTFIANIATKKASIQGG